MTLLCRAASMVPTINGGAALLFVASTAAAAQWSGIEQALSGWASTSSGREAYIDDGVIVIQHVAHPCFALRASANLSELDGSRAKRIVNTDVRGDSFVDVPCKVGACATEADGTHLGPTARSCPLPYKASTIVKKTSLTFPSLPHAAADRLVAEFKREIAR
jgi:hypothetical protein